MEEALQKLISGNFDFVDRLSNSNKITLYVSGSLEDTLVERKYISQFVIPKLELWCSAKGYDFSGIDLRWGLSSEISDDHQTSTIHMQELEKAYNQSAMTIFYFVSGEKYGSVLLPSVISQADREAVRSELKENMKWIIDEAYYLDENGDPPVYKLQKISEIEKGSRNMKFWDGSGK